jgi:ATP-dependent RNA helicase DOB1
VDWGWGVVVNYQKKSVSAAGPGKEPTEGVGARFIVDVLLDCAPSSGRAGAGSAAPGEEPKPVPCPRGAAGGELRVLPVLLPNLDGISSVRMFIPKVRRGG